MPILSLYIAPLQSQREKQVSDLTLSGLIAQISHVVSTSASLNQKVLLSNKASSRLGIKYSPSTSAVSAILITLKLPTSYEHLAKQ